MTGDTSTGEDGHSAAYRTAWDRYRALRTRLRRLSFLAVPAAVGLAFLSNLLATTFLLFWVAAMLLFLAFLVTGLELSRFPCPRCARPFFSTRWIVKNRFRKTCRHCGLQKWAEAP